jgi:streptogramin lyase
MQIRRVARVLLAGWLLVVAGGCGSGGGPDRSVEPADSPPETSALPGTSSHAPTASGASSLPDRPSPEARPPWRAFPIDNAPIGIAAADGIVWAVGDRILLRIDAATNSTRELPIPVSAGSGSIDASAAAIWIADWRGGKVYRVDPSNGSVVASIPVKAPVGVIATPDGIYVGSEAQGGVVRIDPGTNVVTMNIPQRGGFAFGDGKLWFAQRDTGTVVRVEATTGEVDGTIEVPAAARPGPDDGQGACYVGGHLPDAWWTWCFTERGKSVPIRIDPRTLAVTGSVEVGGGVSGAVLVLDGLSWFVLDNRLVAVDARNTVVRDISLGDRFGADGAIVAADSLWIPDEYQRQIVRIRLADLR